MSQSRSLEALGRSELFSTLKPIQLEALAADSTTRIFPARSPIYVDQRRDAVCLVTSGRVKVCAETADGKQQLLYLVNSGEVFREQVLFDQRAAETYYETLERSSILALPGRRTREIANSDLRFLSALARLVSTRRNLVERRLRNVLFLSVEERLIHFLLDLASQYGKQTPSGKIDLSLRLSHQDLANAIGTTRETVTVILGRLQRDSLLKTGRQKMTILDSESLNRRLRLPRHAGSSANVMARSSVSGPVGLQVPVTTS